MSKLSNQPKSNDSGNQPEKNNDDPRFLIKPEDEGRLVALAEKIGYKSEDIQAFYVMAVEGVDLGHGMVTKEHLKDFVKENSFVNTKGSITKPFAFYDEEESRLVGFIPRVAILMGKEKIDGKE